MMSVVRGRSRRTLRFPRIRVQQTQEVSPLLPSNISRERVKQVVMLLPEELNLPTVEPVQALLRLVSKL